MSSWKTAAALLASSLVFGAMPAFAQADLSVFLDGGEAPSLALGGDDTGFAVTITNAGPNAATNVQVAATLPDGTKVTGIDTTCATADAFPCTIATLAVGESATVGFTVNWPLPDSLPTACNTGRDLKLTVSATEADPTATNNASTLTEVTLPMADLTGTVSGPAEPLADGGTPTDRALPGDTLEYSGTVTNNGPCAVPAGALTIDSSVDNGLTYGLEFVSGTGDCADWKLSTPADTSDGVCTMAGAVAPGQTLNFKLKETVGALADKDGGGDSIIQSAATFGFSILYDANPAIAPGDNPAPGMTSLIKGPATACSVTGASLSLFGALGFAAWKRRRKSR